MRFIRAQLPSTYRLPLCSLVGLSQRIQSSARFPAPYHCPRLENVIVDQHFEKYERGLNSTRTMGEVGKKEVANLVDPSIAPHQILPVAPRVGLVTTLVAYRATSSPRDRRTVPWADKDV